MGQRCGNYTKLVSKVISTIMPVKANRAIKLNAL